MRYVLLILVLCLPGHALADWRIHAIDAAERGDAAAAVTLAERERAPWLSSHLIQALRGPENYLGWVVAERSILVYRTAPKPEVRLLPKSDSFEAQVNKMMAAVQSGGAIPAQVLQQLRSELTDPVLDWISSEPIWWMALDGALHDLPMELLLGRPLVHASSWRSAALAGLRVQRARARPLSLFAYARSDDADGDGLPAARAEIALAAAALGGPAVLLSGSSALEELRVAAYDGRLSDARYVLFAAHAAPDPARAGSIALELGKGEGARYAAIDTLHLQFSAELVVLSACETGHRADHADPRAAGFARAAVFAGVGFTLLTRWRIDDAATAQFVAALFAMLAEGVPVEVAVSGVQHEFAEGRHGERYRHPFFWAAWQLWGG